MATPQQQVATTANRATKKPRILFITDSMMLHTGMAIGGLEIAARLHQTGKYEIASFGWFAHTGEARGLKWNFPWRQYTTSDHSKPYGHPHGWPKNPNWDTCPVTKIIKEFQPNIVIAIADMWMADYLYEIPNRDKFKLIHEFPIDGIPVPTSWLKNIKRADIPVVMTEFAKNAILAVDKYCNVEVNPRGLNTSIFFPQTLKKPKDLFRQRYMPAAVGRFVVGVVDRFQDRKQIGRAIESFRKFIDNGKHTDCDLYLHMDINDSASIQQGKTLVGPDGMLKRYNLDGKVIFRKIY